MEFRGFFERVTGHSPFPYQRALAAGPWPTLLDIPTGLGKTAAVIGSWLWKRLAADAATGRRLIYCLPMRVLVQQTEAEATRWCAAAAPLFTERGLETPTVHTLLGGDVDQSWDLAPERPAIVIGTQDLLLSRALNRGYAMSRYRWPVHFALLNNDCMWVFDETQLMGVGVETSAQLDGLRSALGVQGPVHSLWMSATLGRSQLDTVDHQEPEGGWSAHRLQAADEDSELVVKRTGARKQIRRSAVAPLSGKDSKTYIETLAERVADIHAERAGLTLVVVNRVKRAQDLFGAVSARLEESVPRALVHSRFRPADRREHERILTEAGERVVIATQAVEAGVDVSATTLLTELAPWPSLVQRFGRCNRYGELSEGHIEWLDLDVEDDKAGHALPYGEEELTAARSLLEELCAAGDAGPRSLASVDYTPPRVIRPVVRRRDVLDLFDTSADLSGDDVDVSRFVRDGEDTDVQVYWRDLSAERPAPDLPAPERAELCRVSIGEFANFLQRLGKLAQKEPGPRYRAWSWNGLDEQWEHLYRARPGQLVLLDAALGAYSPELGFRVDALKKAAVPPISPAERAPAEAMDSDPATDIGRWIDLTQHLGHVEAEATALASTLSLGDEQREDVAVAGRWHDVGKAHAEFQRRLLQPAREGRVEGPARDGLWAKSNHRLRTRTERPHFRHELASALAWLAAGAAPNRQRHSLVAYLIAAHHGKVRMTLRSLPGEQTPDDPSQLYCRGVWHGDALPDLELPGGTTVQGLELDLTPMLLGNGSWLERMLEIRDSDELGPFRLALLETIVRVADWRASDKEARGDYDA